MQMMMLCAPCHAGAGEGPIVVVTKSGGRGVSTLLYRFLPNGTTRPGHCFASDENVNATRFLTTVHTWLPSCGLGSAAVHGAVHRRRRRRRLASHPAAHTERPGTDREPAAALTRCVFLGSRSILVTNGDLMDAHWAPCRCVPVWAGAGRAGAGAGHSERVRRAPANQDHRPMSDNSRRALALASVT